MHVTRYSPTAHSSRTVRAYNTTAAVSFFMFLGSYEVMFLAINELLNDKEQRDEEDACHSAHIDRPDFHVAAHSSTGPLSAQNKVGLTATLCRRKVAEFVHERLPMRVTRY